MVNVYVFYIASICIHGKELLRQFCATLRKQITISRWNRCLTCLKKLIWEQSDEIYGVNPINWVDSLWKQLSLVSDEEVISLSHAKVYVFSVSVLCLGKMHQNPQSNIVWEDKLTWFKSLSQYRTLDTIDDDPMEFEWNIFPGFTTLQLCNKVQEFMSEMSESPQQFKGRIIFMSMFNDISWGSECNEQECEADANLVSIYARSILLMVANHKKNGTESLIWWCLNLEKADTQFSEPRVRAPEERIKAKEVGNYQYTSVLMEERLKRFFAQLFLLISSVSTEQSQICVKNTNKTCLVRTERFVLAGQSDPLFEPANSLTETPTPSTDDPVQEDLLQKYQERMERLSRQNRVIKFCTDAGFSTTVGVGRYFMTKDTEELSQFTEPAACREYTLPRDEKSSDPKGRTRGNTKIEPAPEATNSHSQGKHGVEFRIESLNKDNSHSWVRISHGLSKLVTDLSNKDDDNEQETSGMKFEEFALKTKVLSFASRSKAKARPRRRTSACSSTRTIPFCERSWTDIEPETFSSIAYPVSKRLSTLLRQRWSSERIWEFSALVWWNVEE